MTAVASQTRVRVVVDHTMPTLLQRSAKLKISHWYFDQCLYPIKTFFIFILWGGTRSLCIPTLRPASQAGPRRNPREGTNELLQSKCLPSLYYGLEACPLSSADFKSLEYYVVVGAFMKIFNTRSKEVATSCMEMFNFPLP